MTDAPAPPGPAGSGVLSPGELVKYHALGNAYLILDAARFGRPLTAELIATLCDARYGIGSDGAVSFVDAAGRRAAGAATSATATAIAGATTTASAEVAATIYNPDGGRAERSGNGLRLCARALWDLGYADPDGAALTLLTEAGPVPCRRGQGPAVTVGMGRPSFRSDAVGLSGPPREVVAEPFALAAEAITITAVSVGNPHCVIFDDAPTPARLARLGPVVATHPAFAGGVNVQLARVRSRRQVEVLVWERGAGPTAASGTSASAVVAAAHRLGTVDAEVAVTMPGGTMAISVDAAGALWSTAPATPVARLRVW